MAFGFGKLVKKTYKAILKPVEKAVRPVRGTLIGAAAGFALGGPAGAAMGLSKGAITGALFGAGMGAMQDMQIRAQEKQTKAQIASAEKIAKMQNAPAVVSAAPTPTQTVEQVAVSDQNEATRKARAFRLSNSVRNSTLGGGLGSKKKVLG